MKRGKIIIAVSLSVVALCLALAVPWILVIAIPLALGVFWGMRSDAEKKALRMDGREGAAPVSESVNNDIRIMQDCVSILNTSENLETVVRRYDDLLTVLGRLCEYEKNPSVSFPHELPSAALRRIESEKGQIMNRAIQRAYAGMLRKCESLKTEKGRKNRQMKFFDELNALMPDFPEETRDFAVDFINRHINGLPDGAGVQ